MENYTILWTIFYSPKPAKPKPGGKGTMNPGQQLVSNKIKHCE